MTVVGVVGDIKGEGLDEPNTRGTVYMPAAQLDQIGFFSPRALAIRTTSNPTALVAALQREIWAVNPNQTISSVATLESIVEGQISDRKVQTGLLTAFAGLALFMAALGVYGLLSFVVTSRTRELGVRYGHGSAATRSRLPHRERQCGVGGLRPRGWTHAGRDRQSKYEQPDLRRRTSRLDIADDLLVLARDGCGMAALFPVWRATRVDPMTVLRALL